MRLVVLSDTHNLCEAFDVPDGDVLVHAGDHTGRGTLAEIERAARFLRALPHEHKVVIAGNHEFGFERDPAAARARFADFTYLQDEGVEIDGVRFWGSPWQPWFHDWAFNLERGAEIRAKWDLIPPGTEVLITHGPPADRLDRVKTGERVGCADLLARVLDIRPRVHVFGHIHEEYGTLEEDGVLYVNGSNCDVAYAPANPPIVLDRNAAGDWTVLT